MEISVFGLGYVGCITAACLARDGHRVIGIDVNPKKLSLLKAGRSPVIEPGLDELIKEAIASGNLTVSSDTHEAIRNTSVSLICVGTPSDAEGKLDLSYVEKVCQGIGNALAIKPDFHTVIVRSTVLPGTVQEVVIPTLKYSSGKEPGLEFGICMNPEFLREGSGIEDYDNPSYIVIGEYNGRSGEIAAQVFDNVDAPCIRTSLELAEMIKYANNAFHALKVTFANEIGNISKAHGIDGREVMKVLCLDQQLNISSAYLKPGFAFGGSCLPKDLRALVHRGTERDLECFLLNSILESNASQISRAEKMIEETGHRKIGILGLSFKSNTDDVRESPILFLISRLIKKGYEISIYDGNVDVSKLLGANKAFIESETPYIGSLIKESPNEVIQDADVVVVATNSQPFIAAVDSLRVDQVLIDLVGVDDQIDKSGIHYDGICW